MRPPTPSPARAADAVRARLARSAGPRAAHVPDLAARAHRAVAPQARVAPAGGATGLIGAATWGASCARDADAARAARLMDAPAVATEIDRAGIAIVARAVRFTIGPPCVRGRAAIVWRRRGVGRDLRVGVDRRVGRDVGVIGSGDVVRRRPIGDGRSIRKDERVHLGVTCPAAAIAARPSGARLHALAARKSQPGEED